MRTERRADQLRPVAIDCGVVKSADGSVQICFGDTKVICTAKLIGGVPGWLRNSGKGWLTAEYSMLPASTSTRTQREAVRGKQTGRTQEIQRLIGRSLRSVTDLGMLGERTVYIDCDVLQADGGTRTAAISGAYVALYLAMAKVRAAEKFAEIPLFDSVAAISVGLVDGKPLLDLDYDEDVAAAVDMNVVMTGSGKLIEVQATAEGEPFARDVFDRLLDLAGTGIAAIAAAQTATIAAAQAAISGA
jgi:ribonuclease PH